MRQRIGLLVVLLVIGASAGVFIASRIAIRLRAEAQREAVVKAEAFLQHAQPQAAAKELAPWREKSPRGEIGERRLRAEMQALEASAQPAEAKKTAERYLAAFPKGPATANAEFIRLRPELEKNPSDPKLQQAADALLTKYPEHPGVARLQIALARAELAAGRKDAARDRLLGLWDRSLPEPERKEIATLLGDINLNLLFNGAPQPGETVITLAQGQYVYNIAREHGVPMEFLLKVNNISDPKKMRVGQTVRIPKVQFSLVCDKAANTLVLYNQGKFFKEYTVRTGRKADATPTGEFKILNKKTEPVWRSPVDGKTYKAGDPDNELGTRWMAFEGDMYGIHGTIRPETIGHYASNGCIGMLKEDVEELFDLLSVGTPLTIVGKQDLARHRVIQGPEAAQEVAVKTKKQ